MQFTARIFRILADAKHGSPPQPAAERVVEAPSHDAGKARLATSFSTSGAEMRGWSD